LDYNGRLFWDRFQISRLGGFKMLEDFKLELILLQKKDTEDAINRGFKNKDDWFRFVISQKKDEVAEAIINLAKRYNVNENVVASYFDSTMLYRILRVKRDNKEITI
jgi:hypothetical protein